jgi:ribA/ribD-fused uncharacterized protein
MYKEYCRRCHAEELTPGGIFLWKDQVPWVLNLATQTTTGGANLMFVRDALNCFVDSYDREGVTSLALPKIAAGLGHLDCEEVRDIIDSLLGSLPIPIFIYEEFIEGLAVDERLPESVVPTSPDENPVLFWGTRYPEWRALSNFEKTPFVINGKQYSTVEHFFQANKATAEWEHEMVRNAPTPKQAKGIARSIRLRPDWDDVKEEVMQLGLLEKFRQNEQPRLNLLSTDNRSIHEASPYDEEWGWINGTGKDRLGRLLVTVRAQIREEFKTLADS